MLQQCSAPLIPHLESPRIMLMCISPNLIWGFEYLPVPFLTTHVILTHPLFLLISDQIPSCWVVFFSFSIGQVCFQTFPAFFIFYLIYTQNKCCNSFLFVCLFVSYLYCCPIHQSGFIRLSLSVPPFVVCRTI